MVIIWLPDAKAHLKEIYLFNKNYRSLRVAVNVRQKIYSSISPLRIFPKMGKIEEFSNKTKEEYRSIPTGKYYKVVYFIKESKIYIAAVFDCRRDPKTNESKL